MPYRKLPIVPDEIYHVFNRSIGKQLIFQSLGDYKRVVETINYYRYHRPPLRFSHFRRLSAEQKEKFTEQHMRKSEPMIGILAYCIMPNHVHFLIQPKKLNSLSDFMRNFQHSYSKYFNTKNNRTGSVFQSMFKVVHVESEEQLLHVSRYIHLNPSSSYLIKIESLESYKWSSLEDYLSNEGKDSFFVDTKLVLSYFKSREDYKRFIFDQAEYQRQLEKIKHLVLE